MKKLILFLFTVIIVNIQAQNNNNHYINVLIDNGKVIDFDEPKVPVRMGLGCSVNYLIPNDIPIGAGFNYYTISTSIINYPHVGESYSLSHFNNGIDDAFHYAKLLIGYRISLRLPDQYGSYSYYRGWNRIDGLSLELRAGTILYNFRFDNPTWLLSPKLTYVRYNIELSSYVDYGFAVKHTNLGYRTVFTCGLSLGYNFRL